VSDRIPHIRGALISGPAAHALARVLDREEITARLTAKGYGERWRELVLRTLEAIESEAGTWRLEAEEHLRREREVSSANGTTAVPQDGAEQSSGAMTLTDTTTVGDAAVTLGCSDSYVRRLARRGVLPGRRDGNEWHLDAAAVADRAARRTPGRRAVSSDQRRPPDGDRAAPNQRPKGTLR
jgi:excisionase family DNA binding protein